LKKDNKYDSITDIWVNFEVTGKIISAKLKDFPWWPAHICIPKDAGLSSTFSKIDRKLVLFVGKQNVRIIYGPDKIKRLSDIDEIDLNEKYDSCTINNLKKRNIRNSSQMRLIIMLMFCLSIVLLISDMNVKTLRRYLFLVKKNFQYESHLIKSHANSLAWVRK